MKKYYLEVKTWKEGMVTVPGPCKVLEEISHYKSRTTHQTVPANVVKNAFLALNENAVDKFLDENIAAVVVAIIVDAVDEEAAVDLVDKCLGPIELDGILEINDENQDIIKEVMGDALNEHPPQKLDS